MSTTMTKKLYVVSIQQDDLAIAAVFHEHAGGDLAVVARNVEPIGTPTLIRPAYRYNPFMYVSVYGTPGGFRQQQTAGLHHPVKTLVVDRLQPHQRARALDHGTHPTVSVGRQCRDLGAYSIDQNGIDGLMEGLCGAAIDPVHRVCHI